MDPGVAPEVSPYEADGKRTTLSLVASRRNSASACALAASVFDTRGLLLRFALRLLTVVGFATGLGAGVERPPDKAVHIAMKATRSRAAGRSQTGACRGLSAVAFFSASRRDDLAATTSAEADVSAASLDLQSDPHCFWPRALLAAARAVSNECSALVSAAWARVTAPRWALRSGLRTCFRYVDPLCSSEEDHGSRRNQHCPPK